MADHIIRLTTPQLKAALLAVGFVEMDTGYLEAMGPGEIRALSNASKAFEASLKQA